MKHTQMIGTAHGEPGNGTDAAPSELAKESGSAGCVSTDRQIDVIGVSTNLPKFWALKNPRPGGFHNN